MSFTCDPTTRAELDASPNKLADAAVIQAALGNTRRIICKRDANAAAPDPWATGTVFRDVGATGALKIVGGRIVGFGRIKGTITSLPADMASGRSVVRIQGNGRWVQGTIGLAGSTPAPDFAVRGNFTATNGLALATGFAISGKRLKPSGTGPAAPTLDANAPKTFEVWNWSNPAAPFLSGSADLTVRADDFVYEDAELAAEKGDVGIYQTATGIFHGSGDDIVEFGFTLLASHAGNTEVGNLPLYEVIGAAAVRGSWTDYPGSSTYDSSKHITTPAPFKVIMKNAAGAVLHTFQMRDGLAINGQQCGVNGFDPALPVRPWWNTGMQLVWENTPQKLSSKATKWYAGMTDAGKRPSRAKTHFSVNGVEPMITGGYQGNSKNGLHTLYYQDQWPRKYKDRPNMTDDPYMPVQYYQNDGSADSAPWMDGWDYEPGSFSGHNWYTGPGGPRFDRAFIPSILALWVSDPNGVRLQGSVPWKRQAAASIKAYHNHSNHWVTNPNTLQLMNSNNDLFSWTVDGTYYGGPPVASPTRIALRGGMRGGEGPENFDKNGRYIWSGWGRDGLHSYGNAGWAALLTNSPRATIAAKWDIWFQLAVCGTGNYNYRQDYMVRSQAWLWLNYVLGWKLASTHPLGFSRAQIESLFMDHLERLYQDIYVPVFINNEDSIFAHGLRNLGVPGFINDGGAHLTQGGGLGYYMSGVLALMKQTGMWSVMYAKGGHIKAVLDMQLRNMDKYCFDKILDTPSSQHGGGGYQAWASDQPVPSSWADYASKYDQPNGQLGLFHNADGSVSNDRDVSVHPMAMYPYMRRDYFPEFPHPRLAAAIAKYDYELGAVAAHVAAATTPQVKRERDHIYGYPGVAILKAPTELGPT